MVLYVSIVRSSLLLNSNPLCGHATIWLFHLPVDKCLVASSFG